MTPLKPKLDQRQNHVSPLNPNNRFWVQEYIGNGYLISKGARPYRAKELVKVAATTSRGGIRWHSKLDGSKDSNARLTVQGLLNRALIRVNTRTAENLYSAVVAYASVLKVAKVNAEKLHKMAPHEDPTLHQKALEQIPFFRNTSLSEREQVLLKGAKYVKETISMVDGLRKDLAVYKHGRYTFLTSNALEILGNLGLDLIQTMKLKKLLPKGSSLTTVVSSLDGLRQITIGMSKHVGTGHLNLNITRHYIEGSKALLEAELFRRGKLTGNLAYLDGIQAFSFAAYKSSRGDVMDVDLVTEYVDAVNNLAWTGLGRAACGLHYACTVAIQKFGTTMAKVLRSSSKNWFAEFVLAMKGNGRKVVEQYMTLQDARISNAQEIQLITDLYSRDLLKANGLSDRQIDSLEDAALIARGKHTADLLALTENSWTSEKNISTKKFSANNINDRGGVDLGPGRIFVIEENLNGITQSILNRRGNL